MAGLKKSKKAGAKASSKSLGKSGSKKSAKSGKPAKAGSGKKTSAKPASKSAAAKTLKAAHSKVAKTGTRAKAAPAKTTPPSAQSAGKKSPKGITIVNKQQSKKSKPKIKLEMPRTEPLLKPGQKWKPLIPSGPKAPPSPYGVWRSSGLDEETEFKIDPKARLGKKDLEKYREILLRKRAELLGDIANMEEGALRTNSGSLSTLPQHMAEQGSDTFDQSISLDLAAVDRRLLREIEQALERINDGTYGVCMKTGKRISAERLAEIPWARYSIEAAREMELRPRTIQAASNDQSASLDND